MAAASSTWWQTYGHGRIGAEDLPHRACHLCTHGVDAAEGAIADRLCQCPDAAGTRPQPVAVMRRHGGACGPEAEHLAFPGLQG